MKSEAILFEEIQAATRTTTHEHDYYGLLKKLLKSDTIETSQKKQYVEALYKSVENEILHNQGQPLSPVKFGTSGWRGVLGKDLFRHSVAQVTTAIIDLYMTLERDNDLAEALGVQSLSEAKRRGCVVGFDNRFCGDVLARAAIDVLSQQGFKIHYAGETTTGVLSACVLQLKAAFSINFTPSHNPFEYGGLKYNAADGGPAANELTQYITRRSNEIIIQGESEFQFSEMSEPLEEGDCLSKIDAFSLWCKHVRDNKHFHGLSLDTTIDNFKKNEEIVVAIDSVHGSSRLHMVEFFKGYKGDRLIHLRSNSDVTFGGVAPEPSSLNMQKVVSTLKEKNERYKLGAIIDPDGDRIRFTDGTVEISMNQFGAMAYHFLHEKKNKSGLVAKTVATSNFVNSIADQLGEEIFEPPVGFKEFKPVIGKALVCFEESDGISIRGHTPEKDAYIGLLLALEMVLSTGKNLHEYLLDLEKEYGGYFPGRGGVEVRLKGDELAARLDKLKKYDLGSTVTIGGESKKISKVLAADGRKMIFEDNSWLMIRPSGTEPKVRFYVESRTQDGTKPLLEAAESMLHEIGLL